MDQCTERCLRIIEIAGVWFAGLATFAAVLISLMLARRARPKLRMSVGLRTTLIAGLPNSQLDVIAFSVVNHGERDVMVEGIAWRRWCFGRKHVYQTFVEPGAPSLPYRLQSGERTMFFFRQQHEGKEWGGDIVREFLRPAPKVAIHLLRVYCYTPTGEVFYGKIERELRSYLASRAS